MNYIIFKVSSYTYTRTISIENAHILTYLIINLMIYPPFPAMELKNFLRIVLTFCCLDLFVFNFFKSSTAKKNSRGVSASLWIKKRRKNSRCDGSFNISRKDLQTKKCLFYKCAVRVQPSSCYVPVVYIHALPYPRVLQPT